MYEAGYRSLIKYSFFLLFIPVTCWVINYSVGYVSGPTLHEGDRVETRTCRQCGEGKTDPNIAPDGSPRLNAEVAMKGGPDGPCPFCRGKGTVEVVLPGPKRPTRFWGAVVDRKNAAAEIEYSCPANIAIIAFQAAFLRPEMRDIQGALPNVRLLFVSDAGEAIESKTDAFGRFSTCLAPGNYRVKVSAGGFLTLEDHLTVAPLVEPVWLEKASSRSPDETGEERRSSMGLALVIALGRTEEDRPSLRTCAVP